jgi:ribosomal protein S3
MSRKVHPLSLRLGHSKTWASSWYATQKQANKTYAESLHRDLEIRRLLNHYFIERTEVHVGEIKIHNSSQLQSHKTQGSRRSHVPIHEKLNQVYHIEVALHSCGKRVDYKTVSSLLHKAFPGCTFLLYVEDYAIEQNRSPLLKSMESSFGRRAPRGVQMDAFLCLFAATLESGKAKFLTGCLCRQLEKTPAHLSVLDLLDKMLEASYEMGEFQGCRVQFKGRLNGSERSRTEQIQHGRVPLQTLSAPIDYHLDEFHTAYGVCSVSVWLYR